MRFRMDQIVPNELHGLSIHNLQMLRLDHGLHKVLVDQLTKLSPLITVMHHKQVVAFCNKIVRHERRRAMIIELALLVDRFFNNPAVCDDSHSTASYLQGVKTSISVSPLSEPKQSCVRVDIPIQ